jgi:hypothetical protein
MATGRGDVSAVAAILDDHPGIINERGTLPGNTGHRTVLHFGSGYEAVVLERGDDPNIRDEGDHGFAIHFAAERGDLAIVKLLPEQGAESDRGPAPCTSSFAIDTDLNSGAQDPPRAGTAGAATSPVNFVFGYSYRNATIGSTLVARRAGM